MAGRAGGRGRGNPAGLAARALAGLGSTQPAHEPRTAPKSVGGRLAEAATAALRKSAEPRLKTTPRMAEARLAPDAPTKRVRLRPELAKRSSNAQPAGGMMRAALSGIKRPKPGGLQTRTPVVRPRVSSEPSVSPKDEAARFRPVNALQIREARSASPCSPERPPARRSRGDLAAAVVERGMSEESAAMSGDSRSCSSHSSSCSEVQITSPPVTSPKVSPRKRPRLATAEQVPPISPQKSGASEVAQGPLTTGGFQAAVLERLKQLCGDHEDAHVLAEYIVVMVAGNKGREDMASEMKPFFSDQAQADSFVTWVEDCKWKFLTGGSSPVGGPKAGTAGVTSSPQQQAKVAVAPTATGLETSRLSSQARLAPGNSVRPGPHVAVTSRVVLQPNPHFDSAPQVAVKTAAIASPGKTTFGKASSPKPLSGNKREKNELLENMTRQLQTILTKLNDRNLNDETREKYQALAQNIQTQMAKISKPQPVSTHRRR